MKKLILLLFTIAFISGCATIGMECIKSDQRYWAKYKRFGWSLSKKQVEGMSTFKEKVCQ